MVRAPSRWATSILPAGCAPSGSTSRSGCTGGNTGSPSRFGDRRFRSRRGERSGGDGAGPSVEPRDGGTETGYARRPPAGILRAVATAAPHADVAEFVGRTAELAELTARIAAAA